MRYAVIMAGGSGTRLWPLSRKSQPKQLLKFIEGRSLLNLAAARLRGLIEPAGVYVCTGAAYTQQVLDDLAILPPSQVLPEPTGRDTANAVGFSAAILAKRDPDAFMAVLTADHIIEPIDQFQKDLDTAFSTAEAKPETLITFGITPTHPATGYGYLQRGQPLPGLPNVHRVTAFKEKPTAPIAEQYVHSGEYFWNSGMFVFKAQTMLAQLKQHLPQSYEGLQKIAAAWDTTRQNEVLNAIYPTLPKISIDFAVMEKAPHVAMVEMNLKWLDVGSWSSFAQTLTPGPQGNRTSGAKTIFLDSSSTLAVSETDHLIATIGTHNLLIIHTQNATLVCPTQDAEKIKQLVDAIQKTYGDKYA